MKCSFSTLSSLFVSISKKFRNQIKGIKAKTKFNKHGVNKKFKQNDIFSENKNLKNSLFKIELLEFRF